MVKSTFTQGLWKDVFGSTQNHTSLNKCSDGRGVGRLSLKRVHRYEVSLGKFSMEPELGTEDTRL